jgi:hypothetical protein
MIKHSRLLGVAFACSLLTWALLSMGSAPPAAAQDKALVSGKTDAAPTLDGQMDEVWSKAQAYTFELTNVPYPSNTYKGMASTKVTMRSLYDSENLYLLVQWSDPTASLDRNPWVKQGDGSWKREANPDSTGHENTFFEDKLAMFWNVNTTDFQVRGCTVVCHKARGGRNAGVADTSPGRKFTNKPGETLDLWNWQAVASDAAGQAEDQYVDDTKDPAKNADWGRKTDSGAGGFVDNINAAKNGPAFMSKDAAAGKSWISDADKVAFADTFKAGDKVAGVIVAPFTGSAGDISAHGRWDKGAWTVELKRKLVTSGEGAKAQDVQFDDLKKTYFFGLSVFDNTEISHLYHEGVHRLTFK